MENDPFGRANPESSSGNESDDSSSSKKKEKKDTAKKIDRSEAPAEDKKTKSAHESLWSRVLGRPEDDKSKRPEKDEAEEPEVHETTAESVEEGEDQAAPLETLSEAEQLEVAEAYIVARQAELVEEQAAAAEEENETSAEERAADIALLEAMRQLLARDQNGEQPLREPVEEAYASTVQRLGLTEAAAPETPEAAAEPVLPVPETMPLPPVAVALRAPEAAAVVPESSATPSAERRSGSYSDTTETRDDTSYNRRKTGGALLVGGVVGYMVGRRRGRIKTEKQFKSVEATLTKHIERVQETVAVKEQQIRRLVREVAEAKAPLPSRSVPERSTPQQAEVKPVTRSERLGLVTLKAIEAPVLALRPETKPVAERLEKKAPAKKLEALSRPELLAAAAEVRVGATTLRQVFETNLVTEQGLRRLMQEHERGGDVRAALEREIIEKETSYERDPRLRNRSVVGSLAASKLVRADIDRPTPPVVPAADDASATPKSADAKAAAKDAPPAKSQTVAVASVVSLVVVIAVLLVILFTSR